MSYNVLLVPEYCNSFTLERLHLVGLWEKREQQVVVRDLWRET